MTIRLGNAGNVNLAVLNMAMRGLSMVAKLALTIYIAKYLTLADIGKYGLLQGVVGAAPAIFGLGINYFMARHLVVEHHHKVLFILRDRLVLTSALSLLGALLLVIFAANKYPGMTSFPVFILLIITECFALDIFQALVGLGRSFSANALLFIRSALWVLIFVLSGLFWPSLRSFEFLVLLWVLGNILSIALAFFCFFDYFQPGLLSVGFDLNWLKVSRVSWGMIYLSDVAIVWQLYADRFILGAFHTVEDVGRYTLYFSLAGSISLLVASGVIQPLLHRFVLLYRDDRWLWAKQVQSKLNVVVFGFFAVAGVATFVAFFVLPGMFKVTTFLDGWPQVCLIMGAMLFRTISDFVTLCFYSAGKDRASASWNVMGMIFSSLVTFSSAVLGDLNIVCLGLFVSSFVLAGLRVASLWKILRLHH